MLSTTVNLLEELVEYKQKQLHTLVSEADIEEATIGKANAIIQGVAKEDGKLLKNFGFNTAVTAIARRHYDLKLKRDRTESLLANSKLFTEEEIRKICIKYTLRFLPVSSYKGDLPVDLSNVLRKLADEGHGDRPLFICAPASSFDLQFKPVDPLLFVKHSSGLYELRHKWGNDLSVFRRMLWMFSGWRAVVTYMSLWLLTLLAVGILICTIPGPDAEVIFALFMFLVAGLGTFVLGLVLNANFRAGNIVKDADWNSPFEQGN